MDDATRTYGRLRPRLLGIAYRMLGSTAEAEAVVQDAYSSWREVASATPDEMEACLVTVIAHLCLDRLRELNQEGKKFGESRLPAPLAIDSRITPEQVQDRADDVSVALLTLLERLPPEARTAFLLREMFAVDYAELAQAIGKSDAECRELVRRAKAQLRDERPRFVPPRDIRFRLLSDFATALASGDFAALTAMLSENAELTGNGSGKVVRFGHPLRGGRRIAQFYLAGSLRYGSALSIELAVIDGQWGLLFLIDGALDSAQSYQIDGERIARIHVQRNPDSLIRIAATPEGG
jgi:RNA polymerase sigma-70 factor (ECF subfamily)